MRSPRGAALAALVVAVGCSSSSKDSPSGGPKGSGSTTSMVIGAKGGVLVHPDGVALAVPPGALTSDQTITVTASTDGPPAEFGSWNSPVFRFTPDGLPLAAPATLTMPFTGSPTGPTLYWASGGATFVPMPTTVAGSSVSASISSLGAGFVGPGDTVVPPPGDGCAPYVGDYAGILAFQWDVYTTGSCVGTTAVPGTGTITIHFTTTCLGPAPTGGGIVLNVPTVSTDDKYYAMPNPGPSDSAFSQMVMPSSPPTKGTGAISIGFTHGGYIDMGPTVTVTTGAAKIASDVGDTKGWTAHVASGDPDDAPYVAAGMPASPTTGGCAHVVSATFKIDKL